MLSVFLGSFAEISSKFFTVYNVIKAAISNYHYISDTYEMVFILHNFLRMLSKHRRAHLRNRMSGSTEENYRSFKMIHFVHDYNLISGGFLQ